MQTMANVSSQSMELSNSLYEVEMERSKSVSTCSNIVHPNTGSFVESVDSSGTTVTSSCVSVERQAGSTYRHQHSPSQSSTMFKNTETAAPVSAPFWAVIEWETTNEEPSSYTLIDSSQIVEVSSENDRADEESGQRKRDSTLYTGKLIHVLRGKYIMPATIVIISEDRQFLETELHELRMMAANKLISKSIPPTKPYRMQGIPKLKHYGRASQKDAMQSQQNTAAATSPENVNSSKRQRCDSGSSSSLNQIESRVSSASAQKVVIGEANPFKADFSCQKTLPPGRSMTVRFNESNPAPKQAPPMTFDQQTQTTGLSSEVTASYDANFVRILSYLESVMAEQKCYRMESEYNRRLLHELQEKICEQHEILQNVLKNVNEMKQTDPSKTSTERETQQSPTNELLIAEIVSNYSPAPGVGTVEDHVVLSSATDSDQQWESQHNSLAEEQQASNSDQIWTSSNNIIIQNEGLATGRSSTPQSMDKSSKAFTESSIQEPKIHDETDGMSTDQDRSNSATIVHELIKHDWVDSMEENESNNGDTKNNSLIPNNTMVAIGSNNTMVSSNVLNNIRWSNYKYATRKVLVAVFSREVLATHSLSGRPCPAHAVLHTKPAKGPLDPKIVDDVVELIRGKFNVDESQVRAVITNKCADEEKMLRIRKARNKENVASLKQENAFA